MLNNKSPVESARLVEALQLWVDLTEVDPSAESFTISMGGGMDSYSIKKMHDQVKEALELDPTNVTGYFLLDAMSEHYFANRKFSVADLLANPERTSQYVAKVKSFQGLVQSPELQEVGRDFQLRMRQAVRHYEADTEAVLKLIEDKHEIAYLRRDALRSMKRLRVDQFLKGKAEPEGVAPAYNKVIHQFWNINSLLQSACHQPSGVTLNLIRDKDDYQSYFAFAIRNGANLFVLSDVPLHAHPLQKYMSRKPERAFGERMSRNWFPYDLMHLAFNEDGEIYFDHASQRGLVPLQQQADRLKELRDLDPREVVWIIMMYDMIVERFWTEGHQREQLTYTGQMVVEELPLAEEAERAQLPVAGYQPLALPALTVSAIRADAIPKAAIGEDGGNPNQWLEDRYAGRVNDIVINLVGTGDKVFYLEPIPEMQARSRHKQFSNHASALVIGGGVIQVDRDLDERTSSWNKEGRYPLHSLEATSFGTREEVENNRIFLARHNLAKAVQQLADEEYALRKEEVECWWSDRINRNLDHLLRYVVVPKVWRVLDRTRFPQARTTVACYVDTGEFAIASCVTEEEKAKMMYFCELSINGGYTRTRGGHYYCKLNGSRANMCAVFTPQTATDLAELAGCKFEELPDVLQHWSASSDHKGNHLLSRIDPMAWALDNPWSRMRFSFEIRLSKSGLKALQKSVIPIENWEREQAEPGKWPRFFDGDGHE